MTDKTPDELLARAKERGAIFGGHANGIPSYLVFTPDEFQAFTHLTAQPVQPAAMPVNWSVFNSGAEVASGLTFAEANDYLTPERLKRKWCAVCVVDESNQPIAQPVQTNPAPGYCKNCKDYTIEEPLFAQPVQPAECPNLKNCEGQCFQCEYYNAETGATEYPAIAQPVQPTSPQQSQDALDAARYRWMRNAKKWFLLSEDKLDAAIDSAIAARGAT